MTDVLCIGHASFDLCMMLDSFPGEDSKAETETLIESGGGPAANAAWLLARWGIPTTLATLLGEDDYGGRALAELQAAGVDCRFVELRRGHQTPVSFIIVNRNTGSRTIINRKATARGLSLPSEKLAGIKPKLLLFDGHEPEASLAAIAAFPSAVTVLDAGSVREGTRTLASRVQYLVCSERFAAQTTGEMDVRGNWKSCLAKLHKLNGNTVVVTLGEHGLMFKGGAEQDRLPPLAIKAVDTTAAGDIFHGAFAFALVRGMDLRRALRLATIAAGLSVQKPGGRPSAPELDTVLKLVSDD
jgi:sugar/nucleoside kinase (ribokinase family)